MIKMKRNNIILSALALTVVTPIEARQPNLIFLLVDDLGKEWIAPYGGEQIGLPNVSRLAEQGIQFDRAYSMPQSTPSRVALLTGQYPYHNGWVNHYDVPRWGHGARFDSDHNPCFPIQLKAAGYKTCIAGKWQLNDFRLEPEIMHTLGFDAYCMWTGGEGGNAKVSDLRYWNPYIHTKEGSKTYQGQFGPDIYSDFVVDFLKKHRTEPIFVYYPLTLTHTPFVATPDEPDAKTSREKHVAMVHYMDKVVGKIMDAVDELGLADDTYLFLATDNGTTSAAVGLREGHYVRGGKTFLTENGINCPFIVRTPSQKIKGRSQALIDFTDVSATLMDLGEALPDARFKTDGYSFAPLLEGQTENSPRQIALAMGSNPAEIDANNRVHNFHAFRDRALIGKQYKVFLTTHKTIDRIYDRIADPYEQHNLIGKTTLKALVEKQFQPLIDQLPDLDAEPKYLKLGVSYYDINPEVLNKHAKAKGENNKNFSPLQTKADYDKFN